ncbi:MAG: AcrB/AcrD/AcrF family protein, partial [Acidobacteria bacterium]
TLVASVTLPLTVLITFGVMHLLGETINVMSMGGLAVAIGLVIDDAVVVVENIHRHLEAGDAGPQAIQSAMKELIAPVTGSTLTTVVVFVPLGLLSGVVGQFFKALSLTLSAAVLISLVLALTLTPLLARMMVRARPAERQTKRDVIEHVYARTLSSVLHQHGAALIMAVLLAAAGYILFARMASSSITTRRRAARSRKAIGS